ncbi:MAG: transposase [Tolypothrix sp. Co-bin9]|nr:transposase [Tolypothrix sp. Co-bin9]
MIQQLCNAKVDVICRTQPGFQVLPKRWIVERTFAWWNQYRRLSKNYELLPVQERIYDLHSHDSFNVETTSKVFFDYFIIIYKQPLTASMCSVAPALPKCLYLLSFDDVAHGKDGVGTCNL